MHKHKVSQCYSPADLPICAKIGMTIVIARKGLWKTFNRYLRGLHLSVDDKLSPCGATLTALLRIYL
jgi:hypothetical protein